MEFVPVFDNGTRDHLYPAMWALSLGSQRGVQRSGCVCLDGGWNSGCRCILVTEDVADVIENESLRGCQIGGWEELPGRVFDPTIVSRSLDWQPDQNDLVAVLQWTARSGYVVFGAGRQSAVNGYCRAPGEELIADIWSSGDLDWICREIQQMERPSCRIRFCNLNTSNRSLSMFAGKGGGIVVEASAGYRLVFSGEVEHLRCRDCMEPSSVLDYAIEGGFRCPLCMASYSPREFGGGAAPAAPFYRFGWRLRNSVPWLEAEWGESRFVDEISNVVGREMVCRYSLVR
jgi:hypothetical protein